MLALTERSSEMTKLDNQILKMQKLLELKQLLEQPSIYQRKIFPKKTVELLVGTRTGTQRVGPPFLFHSLPLELAVPLTNNELSQLNKQRKRVKNHEMHLQSKEREFLRSHGCEDKPNGAITICKAWENLPTQTKMYLNKLLNNRNRIDYNGKEANKRAQLTEINEKKPQKTLNELQTKFTNMSLTAPELLRKAAIVSIS